MQLAKNNSAMWRVISNGDQPPFPIYYSTLTLKSTKKVNLGPRRGQYHQKSYSMEFLNAVWPPEDLIIETANKVSLE